ncbi:MAG: hypothetical protein ACI9W1_002962, partial [Candidatus Azotimanducaceae bacterium]
MSAVPTLDFKALLSSDPDALSALNVACGDHGFFLLS